MKKLFGAVVVALLAGVAALVPAPSAQAATLPSFPMALPVGWGLTVQAGGTHTFSSGVRSSVDLGASGGGSIAVVASADGTVVDIGGTGSFPRCHVTVQHADGWQTKYYHLKGIPSGLQEGQSVLAGAQLGMTAMPGSETCGSGTFRHVHFVLMHNGVEMPIHGLSLGGYTVRGSGNAFCGYWTRNSDGAVVADARSSCRAVPAVANNLINPASLAGAGGASRSEARPVIAPADTIDPVSLYVTEGQHTVSGRAWRTSCEPYSQTERCRTEIWATTVRNVGGTLTMAEGWVFNNLTYVASSRSLWAGNPLGNTTAEWVAEDGRKWRTECDTATSGGNGCRSYAVSTFYAATPKAGGGYTFTKKTDWVFNNIVHFS